MGRADTSDAPRRRRRLSLRVRAGLAFGVTALVLSVIVAVGVFAAVRSNLIDERQEAAIRQAYGNARVVRSRVDPAPSDLASVLTGLQVGPGGDALLEVDGRWYASSVGVDREAVPAALRTVVDAGDAGWQRFDAFGGTELAVGVPINAADARYYELTPFDDVESTFATIRRSLVVGVVVATLVGAAVGIALSGVILEPLRRIGAVARGIAAGDDRRRLDAQGDPELEPLAEPFNAMLDELDARIAREARFASDVTHELRGPLMALSSAVSVVHRRRDQLPPEAVQAVDALEVQVRDFNALVLDLLEISRFDARTASLELRDVDVVELCRAVVDERGEPVPVEGPPGIRARVDARRVHQVLVNLLDNAASYAGGAIAVRVADAPAGRVRIEVDDAGPGVSASEKELVFSRFARGEAGTRPGAPRGTGLGLALSEQHVQLHGGSITVEDRPGGGARFVVELPREPA
jgi:two-component system, OmpR family, sensor histidine kinase MtrB